MSDTHEALTMLVGTHPKATILAALVENDGGISTTDICDEYPVSRPTVARHITDLKDLGIVLTDEIGTAKLHRLDPTEELATAVMATADRATEAFEDA